MGDSDQNCGGKTCVPWSIREASALSPVLYTCIPESLEVRDLPASHVGVGSIGLYLFWLPLAPASPLASSPTESIFLSLLFILLHPAPSLS